MKKLFVCASLSIFTKLAWGGETIVVETDNMFPGVAEQEFSNLGFNVVTPNNYSGFSAYYISIASDDPANFSYSNGVPVGAWRNNFVVNYICNVKGKTVVLYGMTTFTSFFGFGNAVQSAPSQVRNSLVTGVKNAADRLKWQNVASLKSLCAELQPAQKVKR